MAHASLERQLLQARSEKVELEAKLRERDSTIERLEGDRRLLALREQSEREEKEQEQAGREKDKVRKLITIRYAASSHVLLLAILTCGNPETARLSTRP